MDIRVKAAVYAIGWFLGVFLVGIGLNLIMPYLEVWMGWVIVFGVLFYMVYSLMLTKLEFDVNIDKLNKPTDKE